MVQSGLNFDTQFKIYCFLIRNKLLVDDIISFVSIHMHANKSTDP
jgi:hypothetical protein